MHNTVGLDRVSIAMSKFHRVTPLIPGIGSNIFLKLEYLQPSGSFKDRGIGHMVSSLMASSKVEKLICSSGGNAGHAVATVGREVSLPVDVYVPVTTKAMMVEKIRKTGANVIIGGENWYDHLSLSRQILN
jgi:L-serine/L-threonine ammonia-lyase